MTHSISLPPVKRLTYTILALSLTAMILLFSGCQSQPVKRVTLHKGMDYKTLLDNWGQPQDQSYDAANELTRYFWKLSDVRLERSSSHSGVSVSPSGTITSAGNPYQNTTVRHIYCNVTVLVDQQNRVTHWEGNGEGCRQILYHQI